MRSRFYLPGPLDTETVMLPDSEAHHLLHVLRKQVGDQVFLFNGEGTEATAEIIGFGRNTVELRIVSRRTESAIAPSRFVVGVAVPKGDRFRWLVEKATELGVERLIPLQTARSVVDPRANKLDKLRQTVIAASKQCGRLWLMEITEPIPWEEFVLREFPNRLAYVAHPTGEPIVLEMPELLRESELSIAAAVGPEGGFTDQEVARAVASGANLVNLGSSILRVETAALAVAALFSMCFSEVESSFG